MTKGLTLYIILGMLFTILLLKAFPSIDQSLSTCMATTGKTEKECSVLLYN